MAGPLSRTTGTPRAQAIAAAAGLGALAWLAWLPGDGAGAGVGGRRAWAGDAPCPPSESIAGTGAIDPFRAPAPEATALNAAAKTLYRQGRWEEARAQYRAAERNDGEFLAPALNIACSFVRQERFAEATGEVLRLLDRAYIPWSREVLAAADLGALKAQPQMDEIRRALALDARRWGADLENSLLFVARQHEPLHLPPAASDAAEPVVLVLGLHQEVFAWSPVTGRYRQITAEDGRVVAMAASADRRHLLYVTAEKLVRNPKGPATLRGVTLHRLLLPLMTEGKPTPIEGDVRRLTLWPSPPPAGFTIEAEGDRVNGVFALASDGGPLVPSGPPPRSGKTESGKTESGKTKSGNIRGGRGEASERGIVLTAAGVTPGQSRPLVAAAPDDRCHLVARAGKNPQGIPTIQIVPVDRRGPGAPLVLRPRFGAGIDGLSIP
jgi:hypothetical protein